MDDQAKRRYEAGQWLDDDCRQCKLSRKHTVLAASAEGEVLRVSCDYCGAQHNYRGNREPGAGRVSAASRGGSRRAGTPEPFPLVSERERSFAIMHAETSEDLEVMLRRIIREESGLTPAAPAEKWRGGSLVLWPGQEGLQEKSWPIETFFHKVVMVRNRLRTLEQQVNAAELPEGLKIKLQGYITACYGSLTSFNLLFAEDEDRFGK